MGSSVIYVIVSKLANRANLPEDLINKKSPGQKVHLMLVREYLLKISYKFLHVTLCDEKQNQWDYCPKND